jgi:hypothetical protein
MFHLEADTTIYGLYQIQCSNRQIVANATHTTGTAERERSRKEGKIALAASVSTINTRRNFGSTKRSTSSVGRSDEMEELNPSTTAKRSHGNGQTHWFLGK